MKNPFIAGAIAGVIGAIVATISLIIAAILELPWEAANLPGILSFDFLTSHLAYEIMLYLVFGSIFGVIYSVYYDYIPSKGISKGLVYGLIIYLISNIRAGILFAIYFGYEANNVFGWWWPGFFTLVPYGLALGALFRKPARAIRKYDVKSGVFYGVIAGIVSGITATIVMVIGVNLTVWELPGLLSSAFFSTNHIYVIIVAIAFGAIFGAIFSMVYDSTPSKGILKGLVYGLMLYLLANIRTGILLLGYNYLEFAKAFFWLGFFTWIVFGIVLGLLYKPPK